MGAQQYRLRYSLGEGPWQEKLLQNGEYTMGRSPDCDIVLAELDVSRFHTKLEIGPEGVYIMDLGSANGTVLDGKPLPPNKKKPLSSGQIFEIVNFRLSVEPFEEGVEGATPPPAAEVEKIQIGEQGEQPSAFWKQKTMVEEPGVIKLAESTEAAPPPAVVPPPTTPSTVVVPPPAAPPTVVAAGTTEMPKPAEMKPVASAEEPQPLPLMEMQTQVNVEPGAVASPHEAKTRVAVPPEAQPPSSSGSGEPIQSYILKYRKGSDPWQQQPLPFGEYVLGRTGDCDFILPEVGVSRHHAKLEVGPDGAYIMDLGSGNGTQIDGLPTFPRQRNRLQPTQVITIDMFSLMVEGVTTPAPALEEVGAQVEEAAAGFMPGVSESPTRLEPLPVSGPQPIILRWRKGDDLWQERRLNPGEYIMGRLPELDIPLVESSVSRRHAKLEVTADGCFITDLGSANGTQVDNKPLTANERTKLTEGQMVSAGSFTLTVQPAPVTEAQAQMGEGISPSAVTRVAAGPIGQLLPVIVRYHKGNEAWREYALQPGEQIIGRGTDAYIRLDSQIVSRHHAKIRLEGQQAWVADLGSKNGVQKKGENLVPNQEYPLAPGDTFQVDEFAFEFIGPRSLEAAAAAPTRVSAGALFGGAEREGATILGADLGLAAEQLAAMSAQKAPINLMGQERVAIGRAPDNQIVLDHPLVSRYHAVIERMGTRSRIIDLHSANGVFINGQPVVEQAWLKQGDMIKIGSYQIEFTGNELRHSAVAESYCIDAIGIQKWVSKKVNLLQDISLSVGQNEFVALVGMSGAGKSTLMDAINGFRPGTHGRVLINGIDLYSNYGMFRDDIGNVPQRDIVHMELTPEQALDYAAQLRMPRDTTRAERRAAVNETLEETGLTARRKIPISRLSGGQIKRVSIGVELLTKPRLFFLDEPTSGLDPGTEYEMMKLLRRLADQGRSIMIITHATKNVMFCDKAIILARGGNLAFYGPPEDALDYFDSYRTKREQLEKDMEFDDIYRILNDTDRGKPEDWRERYLKSKYAKYVQPRYQPVAAPAGAGRRQRGRRIGQIRQFFILSARNIRLLVQDRASLGLILALAPILGLMNFIWGNKLFDPVSGDVSKVMAMWFIAALIPLLAGSMGAVREIVKENDIYKRERAVGLKIFPYVVSKIWIGVALAIYQGTMILLFVLLLVQPKINNTPDNAAKLMAYGALWVTIILAVVGGYLLGLVVSALAPNQNSAQIILIAFLVPQILFAGMLQPLQKIPMGEIISPFISTRWTYESFINASGMGKKLDEDPCWQMPKDQRIAMDAQTKEKTCICMGPQIFTNCNEMPGIFSPDYYDAKVQLYLAATEPVRPAPPMEQPTSIPSPTFNPTPTLLATPTYLPTPTFLPTPTAYDTPTMSPFSLSYKYSGCPTEAVYSVDTENCYRNYTDFKMKNYQKTEEEAMHQYQLTREAQFSVYRDDTMNQVQEYQSNEERAVREYKGAVEKQVNSFVEVEKDKYQAYGDAAFKQFQDYADYFKNGYLKDMENYSNEETVWQKTRQQAIGAAEAIIGRIYDDYGRTFKGSYLVRWVYIALIAFGEFIIILILMKRKDTI